MSRLIDADKLIEQLDDDINITSEFVKKSIKYDDYRDFDKSFAVLYMLKSYRAIVEGMPTAFDVEQLEEFKEYKKNKHRSLRCMYEKGYNKGIDETCNYICCEWSLDRINTCEDFDKISQQLKAGGIDE